MSKLNFAIIGFGKMGEIRYKTLAAMPRCTVVAVCEPGAAARTPKGIPNVSATKILADKNIDAVIICTPNDLLKNLTVAALKAGKHVFCEKPPGRNMAELNAMVKAEKAAKGKKLMFGFNHRHHGSMLHAKKLIDSGEYGKVLWMRGRYGKSVDEKFFSNWRSKQGRAGGGIFLDQGIHMLDLFLMFCSFDDVHAFVSNLYWKLDIEDNVFAIFRNKKTGQVASLHSTMTQWRHLFSLEIFLERGYITINGLKTSSNTYGDEAMTIVKNRSLPPAAVWTKQEDLVFHTDYSWKKEMKVFVEAICNDTAVPVGNTKDALKLMGLVEKVYKNR